MDGMHDLGGKQGFGPVVKNVGKKAVYRHSWEAKAHAISGRMVALGIYNMDEYRHAVERMSPSWYMNAMYYERILAAVSSLCVEKGVVSADALNEKAGHVVPLVRPIGPGRQALIVDTFVVGEQVRVKNEFFGGHTRMPAYIRGKTGLIVALSPRCPYPDAGAHGLQSDMQATYDVRFNSEDLWPDASDKAKIHVNVFAAYLERAAGGA